jgi:hypothetical protein
MIHLSAPRMNGVLRRTGFIQNLLLESSTLWHNQDFLEPYGTFCILVETSDLRVTLLHPSLDMTHSIIILLRSYDLDPQGRHEGDVEQCQVR